MSASNRPIYVTRPHLPPLKEFVDHLERIWASGVLTNRGPMHRQLEDELARHLGVGHVALFNNGMQALVTALQALELKGEVITTPYSFVATTHAIVWNDLVPVFVDVEPGGFNIDAGRIAAAITERTCAIMPVHCYGWPCDVERIAATAQRFGLKVIYDSAHAFGVRIGGRSVLEHGDLSVLSFHATKVFNTFEGGAIVCPNAEIKARIDRLKNFGIRDEDHIEAVGLNGKMNEVQAAFGLVQLRHIDAAIERRGTVCERYRELLAGTAGIELPRSDRSVQWNHAYFPVRVREPYPISRDALYERLHNNGIIARKYFYPLLSELPMYRNLPSAAPANLPNATRLAREVLCLPLYPELTEADVERIVGIIRVPERFP